MSQKFENLSALMDGEVEEGTDVKSLVQDEDISQKWKSYHLTRDLLRGDASDDLSFDISSRVAEALEQELPIVAPKPTWRENPVVASVIPIFKQSSQLAAAACVTALVIFGVQSYNQPEEEQPFIAAPSQFAPIGGMSPVSLQQGTGTDQSRMNQLLEQRKQINALIEDHERQLKLKQTDEEKRNNQESPSSEPK